MTDRSRVLTMIRGVMTRDEEMDEFFTAMSETELEKLVFHSPVGLSDNIRLSATGCEFLKKEYEYYEQNFESDYVVTARDLLFLKQNCTCPYYISLKKKHLILFEEALAIRVRLVSGKLSVLV